MEKVLKIQGIPVTELAQQFKTPLYVYDEGMLRQKLSEYKTLFQSDLFTTEVIYACKAFCVKGMIKLVDEYGLSLDVVSGGEIYTAISAGFDPNRMYFNGNNKSIPEMDLAIKNKVKTFFVDNIMEARYLVERMKKEDYVLHIILRVNPGIDAHTHKYIVTANVDSKFGIAISLKKEIAELIHLFDESENIVFDGFQTHIGSQIFDKNAYVADIETMTKFMYELEQEYGIKANTLDLGGGFAAVYTQEDTPIPLPVVCETIISNCQKMKLKYNLSFNRVMIEPGRSIVAEAGSTIYTIGFMKETLHKKYIFVDGGMSDNIRPCLYQAKYACDVANKMDEEKTETVCVAGKLCESGDILIEEAKIPSVEPGDLLITYTTGAYGYSMSSNYNRIGRPPVVFVNNGKARLVVKGQTYEDLVSGDLD